MGRALIPNHKTLVRFSDQGMLFLAIFLVLLHKVLASKGAPKGFEELPRPAVSSSQIGQVATILEVLHLNMTPQRSSQGFIDRLALTH